MKQPVLEKLVRAVSSAGFEISEIREETENSFRRRQGAILLWITPCTEDTSGRITSSMNEEAKN